MADFDPKPLALRPSKYWSLEVSLDYNVRKEFPHPVFLVTADNDEPAPRHWHIPITKHTARRLRDWLNDYLGEVK